MCALLQYFPDTYADREVLPLHVRCAASQQGCQWQGPLKQYEVRDLDLFLQAVQDGMQAMCVFLVLPALASVGLCECEM